VTKNATAFRSRFYTEFGDELLSRMAKKSTFDEKHESEVAKHEDEKDERNK
jgi:hypothetical protein